MKDSKWLPLREAVDNSIWDYTTQFDASDEIYWDIENVIDSMVDPITWQLGELNE